MHSAPVITSVPRRFDLKPGDYIAGTGYCVRKHLGEGSFGDVYRVEDPYGREWAVKLLRLWDVPSTIRQPLIDRFEMEYKTGCIDSRYLVHSEGYGFHEGNPYIVMEFCPGGDLTQFIGQSEADVPKYAREVLLGLHDLHVNGKVHRDLKPENVLIKADGTAVLTDFGISGDRNKRMTEMNIFGKPFQVFGTYAYMPPEQVNRARGGSTVLPTTDIFSFGVVVYQLLTGSLPFGKLDDQNDLVYYQKKSKAGEWDRMKLMQTTHGGEWMKMIEGCLVPDYKQRFQSSDETYSFVPHYSGAMVHNPPRHRVIPLPQKTNTGHHRLRIAQGEEFGRTFDLEDIVRKNGTRVVLAGRSELNPVQLKEFSDFFISRKHFTIESKTDGKWLIRDGQWDGEEGTWKVSSNGTFVNSKQVLGSGFYLTDGDIISIGDVKLLFESY